MPIHGEPEGEPVGRILPGEGSLADGGPWVGSGIVRGRASGAILCRCVGRVGGADNKVLGQKCGTVRRSGRAVASAVDAGVAAAFASTS